MIMQRRVAGCARAIALLRTQFVGPTSRAARSHVYAAQHHAAVSCFAPARAAAHMQSRSWRVCSQLIHASPTAPQPPEPADLDQDVDVLIEGAPRSLDRCAGIDTGSAAARVRRVARPVHKDALVTSMLRLCGSLRDKRRSRARATPASSTVDQHPRTFRRYACCRASLESLAEGLRMDAVRAVHAALLLEAAELGVEKPARATSGVALSCPVFYNDADSQPAHQQSCGLCKRECSEEHWAETRVLVCYEQGSRYTKGI